MHALMSVCSWSVIVVLANSQDSLSILLEAGQQGLMNGEYVFFLLQHFEVSGSVVSETIEGCRLSIRMLVLYLHGVVVIIVLCLIRTTSGAWLWAARAARRPSGPSA